MQMCWNSEEATMWTASDEELFDQLSTRRVMGVWSEEKEGMLYEMGTGRCLGYNQSAWGVSRRCEEHGGKWDCKLCRVASCSICQVMYYPDQVVVCEVCQDDNLKNICFGCVSRLIDTQQAMVGDDADTVESKYACPFCRTVVFFVPPQDMVEAGATFDDPIVLD